MEKNFNVLVIFWTSNFFPVSSPKVTDNFLQVCRDLGKSLTQSPNFQFQSSLFGVVQNLSNFFFRLRQDVIV